MAKDRKGLTFEKNGPTSLDAIYSKIFEILILIALTGKIDLILFLWFIRNVECFESSNNFSFSKLL